MIFISLMVLSHKKSLKFKKKFKNAKLQNCFKYFLQSLHWFLLKLCQRHSLPGSLLAENWFFSSSCSAVEVLLGGDFRGRVGRKGTLISCFLQQHSTTNCQHSTLLTRLTTNKKLTNIYRLYPTSFVLFIASFFRARSTTQLITWFALLFKFLFFLFIFSTSLLSFLFC